MSITILFQQSKAIHNYVKESMNQEAKKPGFDLYGNTGQAEFQRFVMELEQQSLYNLGIDWEFNF